MGYLNLSSIDKLYIVNANFLDIVIVPKEKCPVLGKLAFSKKVEDDNGQIVDGGKDNKFISKISQKREGNSIHLDFADLRGGGTLYVYYKQVKSIKFESSNCKLSIPMDNVPKIELNYPTSDLTIDSFIGSFIEIENKGSSFVNLTNCVIKNAYFNLSSHTKLKTKNSLIECAEISGDSYNLINITENSCVHTLKFLNVLKRLEEGSAINLVNKLIYQEALGMTIYGSPEVEQVKLSYENVNESSKNRDKALKIVNTKELDYIKSKENDLFDFAVLVDKNLINNSHLSKKITKTINTFIKAKNIILNELEDELHSKTVDYIEDVSETLELFKKSNLTRIKYNLFDDLINKRSNVLEKRKEFLKELKFNPNYEKKHRLYSEDELKEFYFDFEKKIEESRLENVRIENEKKELKKEKSKKSKLDPNFVKELRGIQQQFNDLLERYDIDIEENEESNNISLSG